MLWKVFIWCRIIFFARFFKVYISIILKLCVRYQLRLHSYYWHSNSVTQVIVGIPLTRFNTGWIEGSRNLKKEQPHDFQFSVSCKGYVDLNSITFECSVSEFFIIINIKDWTLWFVPSLELQLLSPAFLRSPSCSPSLYDFSFLCTFHVLSRVTTALTNIASVFQLFSFLVWFQFLLHILCAINLETSVTLDTCRTYGWQVFAGVFADKQQETVSLWCHPSICLECFTFQNNDNQSSYNCAILWNRIVFMFHFSLTFYL
jgi:hypothetical protein